MKTKNIPPDIKSKSINEAKLEIQEILERLEKKDNTNLEGSTNDYQRLLILNEHIDNLFKEKLVKIRSIGKKR